MAHTFKAKNGSVFIHNPDLSGRTTVINTDDSQLDVDGTDLLEFAVSILRDRYIAQLEDSAEPDVDSKIEHIEKMDLRSLIEGNL